MSTQVGTTKGGDKIPQKAKKTKSTLKDKVRKHITDINDVISDDDIRDAQIDTTNVTEEIERKEEELEKNAEVNGGNEKEGKKKITPWDVLDE